MFQTNSRFVSVLVLPFVACRSSHSDHPDAGSGFVDAAAPDAAVPRDAAAPTFLAASAYNDLFTIDPGFPFGVVSRHAADATIAGSHWGRANGPQVTLGVYGMTGKPAVVKWALPTDPTAAATATPVMFTAATGLPAGLFYGADGMIDLPFGSFDLLDYSTGTAPFTGEALLYDAAYDAVESRAFANGLFSGIGVTDGTHDVLIYSGESPLTAATTATSDNGLYAAPVCNGKFLDASCAASVKIVPWTGFSGPVVTDTAGNVFVAADLSGGATTDAVYAITQAQALAAVATTNVDLAEVNTMGTSSLAAVSPIATAEGWVLGTGFDASAGVYASSYTQTGGALAAGPHRVATAIATTAAVTGISMFTDPTGNLWLAVTTATSGDYLELARTE